MKKLILSLFLAVGALAARAQDTAAATQTPAIDQMVYLSFIPAPSDLMADAKRNGLTILRLDKMADRVVVTYRYPDGHTSTLGYAHLNSATSGERTVAYEPADERVVERRTTVIERDPEIVYVDRTPRTRVVYRESYDDFWPPLVLGLGIGYLTGHNSHGHWHSSYHGGWHGRGGWRR